MTNNGANGNNGGPKRVVIVGGVAGGASAAARARRVSESAEIVMFERGADVSFANCGLPYHIGQTIKERQRLLVQTPDSLHRRFGLTVHTRTEVMRIDREGKRVVVRDLSSGREREEGYDVLILSPGAEPVRPAMPGAQLGRVFTLRSMADMDAIKKVVDEEKPGEALVVGGGYIGLEMAEALRQRQVGVVLVEMAAQVMNVVDVEMASPLHAELKANGVELRLGASVTSFEAEGKGLLATLSTGEKVRADLAIMAVGVKPEVKLAKEAGLEIGQRGGIVVDEHMRTSDPSIYAVGDAVEVRDFVGDYPTVIPLAGPANRQGRIAADNAFGRERVYRKTQGTAICKVFDLAVAMTGASEKALRRAGRAYEKIYVHPASHASYYPDAQPMSLKLLFDPKDGKILGAQAVGRDGVDKRIDVLAVALRAGMTVFDLEELELCYAPPYGSAKDPVNYAGFVAGNVLRGDVGICHVEEVRSPRADQMLLDVRNPAELAAGAIAGAVNIPLDELRGRLGELPRDKEILVNCQVGLRGYLACRILMQNGFKCRNLSGGYKTYAMFNPVGQGMPPATKQIQEKKEMCATTCGAGAEVAKEIDACGLACPGPVMRLKQALDEVQVGQVVRISVTDSGFAQDVPAWCKSTGHELVGISNGQGRYQATVRKCGEGAAAGGSVQTLQKHKTMVVFSGDLDKALAAFIIANGAAAMGSKVTLFFTFWGLNVLRKPESVLVKKNVIEKMFGWMMPRGASALRLSKMHMGGMGTAMIKGIMAKHKVPSLPELIESARKAGVRLVACSMSMELMGFKPEEFIEGVEFGGVAMYLNQAEQGNVNLFV